MAKVGRPTDFNDAMAKLIVDTVSSCTNSLDWMHKNVEGFPDRQTVYKWRYNHPGFDDAYIRAKRKQSELMAEELEDIAQNGSQDYMIDSKGHEAVNHEHISRSRLIIDTRKWMASKLAPKLYGDRQVVEQHNYNHESSIKDLDL